VKPHGALYNMSARNATIAATIARAVKDADPQLVLYGLSGSCSVTEAAATGLKTASEVFADRTYREDGSLTPRSQPGAMIVSAAAAVKQVLQMVNEQCVTTTTGKIIPVAAQTICIHGDGANAITLARAIHAALTVHQTGDIE
jgi:5-oxoprolinase (ATP-hydrolysing) subunit A